MRMSVDNSDIEQVVQYRVTKSMCSFNQRAGRAARGQDATGKFIWLVELWIFDSTIKQYNQQQSQSQSSHENTMNKAKQWSKLSSDFWQLLNETACIHQTILKFFAENFISISELNKVNCCCRCAETIIKLTPAHNMQYIQSDACVTKTVKDTLTD